MKEKIQNIGNGNSVITVENIPVNKIVLTENTRTKVDTEDLASLKANIASVGLLQPIGVIRKNGTYELAWGFRRLECIKQLKQETISAAICENADPEALKIIENLQRKNITPLELAAAIRGYREKSKLTFQEISGILGKTVTEISQLNRINDLIKTLKTRLSKGELDIESAKYIGRFPEKEQTDFIKSHYYTEEHSVNIKNVLGFFKNRNISVSSFPFPLDKEYKDLPGRKCEGCSDRSSAQSSLFPDLSNGEDKCLNRNCMVTRLKLFLKYKVLDVQHELQSKKEKLVFVKTENYWIEDFNFSSGLKTQDKEDLKLAGKNDQKAFTGIIVASDKISDIGQVHRYVGKPDNSYRINQPGQKRMDDLSPDLQMKRRIEIYKRKKDLINFPMSLDIGEELMKRMKNRSYKSYKTIPTEVLGAVAEYVVDRADFQLAEKLRKIFDDKRDRNNLAKIFQVLITAATWDDLTNKQQAEYYSSRSDRYKRLKEISAALGEDLREVEKLYKPKYDKQVATLKERFILRNKFDPEKPKTKKKK